MLYLYGLTGKAWERWQARADQFERALTEQQITQAGPGAILRDIEMLIEFIGPDGILTKGRNGNIPPERLPELNRKSSSPIELKLKRALLRDYPNLSGLFILLRVMELIQVQRSRLVWSPAALQCWGRLNSTERYFALLEALLFHAQTSVLGGQRTQEQEKAFRPVSAFLGQLTDRWCNFDQYESVRYLGPQGELPTWNLFLQQQLGLIEIRPGSFSDRERNHWGGRGWLIGGARLTPWGAAMTWALLKARKEDLVEKDWENDGDPQEELALSQADEAAIGPAKKARATEEDADEQLDDREEDLDQNKEASFGILQPVFQHYFPEWQTVYQRPKPEVRSGTHIFKVILAGWRGQGGGIWRRLAVPPHTSLDELAGAILNAFKLDSDHLYDFRYRDQRGRKRIYNHPYTDEGPFTHEILVSETELAIKDQMLFTFDYGDYWQFEVRLEAVEAGPCQLTKPKLVESAGKAPEQYPQSGW